MKTALVLSGNFGSSLAVTRALGRAGWRIIVDGPGTNSARSRWAAATVTLPDAYADPDRFSEALVTELRRSDVDLLVPSTDHEVALAWRAVDEADGTAVLGGDRESARRFLDKARTIELARQFEFPVPESHAPPELDAVGEACAAVGYPCVIKPRRSYIRLDGALRYVRHCVVANEAEAAEAAAARTGDDGQPPIVQQLVPGRSLSVTVVAAAGRVVARAARETFSFLPVHGGISVFKRTVPPETPGVEAATSFLLAAGLQGLAELEFQLDADAVPRLMEVGPRPHGWLQLAEAARPGLIEAAAAAAQGFEPRPLPPYASGVEMRWVGGELRRLRFVLAPGAASRRSILSTAWPLWRPGMLFDNVDLADPGPWAPRPLARLLAWGSSRG